MLDPVVHAALFVVFAWLVQLAATAVGVHVGNDVATGLAQVIVDYILSLFGYSLYTRIKAVFVAKFKKPDALFTSQSQYHYHPPFG